MISHAPSFVFLRANRPTEKAGRLEPLVFYVDYKRSTNMLYPHCG